MHGRPEARAQPGAPAGSHQRDFQYQQRCDHRVEGQSASRRLGIRRRAGRAGDGFLGTRTVKPSPYAKPGAITGARPTGVRPGLTRQPTAEERRRAQRVLLRMPVLVHIANNPKAIEGFTHTVSATGGMIILKEGLSQGTKFTLEIPERSRRSK